MILSSKKKQIKYDSPPRGRFKIRVLKQTVSSHDVSPSHCAEINYFRSAFIGHNKIPSGNSWSQKSGDNLKLVQVLFGLKRLSVSDKILFRKEIQQFDLMMRTASVKTAYSVCKEPWCLQIGGVLVSPLPCEYCRKKYCADVVCGKGCKLRLVGIEENPGPQRKGKRRVKSKKKVNRADYSTAIVRGPSSMSNLLPDTKIIWLEFNNPTTVILTAAASNFAFLNLHPNDLFRPVVGTAVQYTGLTAMDTFYNYYLVEKWQLDMEFINADVVPKEVFVIPTPQDLTGVVSTPAEAQFYVGSRGVPTPKLVSATGGMDRATIRYSMNCPKFYGERVEYETSYNAISTSSPANFLNCALVAVTTTANMTFGLMVRLKMRARVKFYQRKAVA